MENDANTVEKTKNHISSALATMESIREMVAALTAAREAEDDERVDEAERTIHEDALSVEVRDGWRCIGDDAGDPIEYKILLGTGGPAVQIRGTLNEYAQPATANLQAQDWFIPWEGVAVSEEDTEALLVYASTFYYGEN